MRIALRWILAGSLSLAAFAAAAQDRAPADEPPSTPLPRAVGLCGELGNAYGPFDYRTDKNKLGVVEAFHFTPSVENLQHGKSGSLGGDLDYTLRAFPNHHRALYAMMRLGERSGTSTAHGAHFPVECYFERAIRFRPDDAQVHALYGFFLVKGKRLDEARKQFEAAEKLDPQDPQVLYNIGLGYADLKDYDKSLQYAHKAYKAGVRFGGLRERLQQAGRWRDASG
ncbi:MAG: tetratricopeptide repeat protein [Burkholderiaceae bacterium]|nr:tetratricopeptide repeat protein [Burkholderiaceae bacterium]